MKETIEAKYLGIDIKVRGKNPIKTKEQKMITQAKAKAYTILNLKREGINRAKIARTLWESTVIPAVLYATEIMIGKRKKTNEAHVVVECSGTEIERATTGINKYIRWAKRVRISSESRILKSYLGGDGAKKSVLKQRGMKIQWIITKWLQKTAVM